jgi:hypothetical protein
MRERNADLPDTLFRLAGLLGEVLGGPSAPTASIDEQLVALALRRHDVGPLLYAAASGGRHAAAPALLQQLKERYDASKDRRASALRRLQQIAAEFRAHDIGWMTIKGVVQAEQLYADPAWRDSADIDMLVTPREFQRALEKLMDIGYIASNPPMPRMRLLRKPILGAVRDVSLVPRDDHSCSVELHRRLFFPSGARAQSLRLNAAPGVLPAPAIGPDLACYLIAHGASCFWVRLKWLVDLVPLFAKLSSADSLAIPERARRMKAESSTAASLLLLRMLFPFVALDPLTPWLERKQAESAVQLRVRRYAQMLSLSRDWKSSPLDDARMALEAQWMVFEALSTRARLLVSAPVSAGMRRLAGSFSKADRALTQSAEPP